MAVPTHLAELVKLRAKIGSPANELEIKELEIGLLPRLMHETAHLSIELEKVCTEA